MDRLPYPPIGRPPKKWQLLRDTALEQWIIPAGTWVTLKQGDNFGIIVLPENCVDVYGHRIPKRIFKE